MFLCINHIKKIIIISIIYVYNPFEIGTMVNRFSIGKLTLLRNEIIIVIMAAVYNIFLGECK